MGWRSGQVAGPSRDPEEPAAHVSDYLALLPSGPDAVRRLRLHRVRAAPRPVTTPLGGRGRPEMSQSIAGSRPDQGPAPTHLTAREAPGNPRATLLPRPLSSSCGEMFEQLKEHAWKWSASGATDCDRRRPTCTVRATWRQRRSPAPPVFSRRRHQDRESERRRPSRSHDSGSWNQCCNLSSDP